MTVKEMLEGMQKENPILYDKILECGMSYYFNKIIILARENEDLQNIVDEVEEKP